MHYKNILYLFFDQGNSVGNDQLILNIVKQHTYWMLPVKYDSSMQLNFWKVLFKMSESKPSENLHTKIWNKVLRDPVLRVSVFKKIYIVKRINEGMSDEKI